MKKFFPWEAERSRDAKLTDLNGILAGRFPPTVRKLVARLPSGALALGMADAVVLNDPITGQGSNNAAKAARMFLKRILDSDAGSFDVAWMQQTFDEYWQYAQFVTGFYQRVPSATASASCQYSGRCAKQTEDRRGFRQRLRRSAHVLPVARGPRRS